MIEVDNSSGSDHPYSYEKYGVGSPKINATKAINKTSKVIAISNPINY
ncbi:MAG TPA: hypothetical protein VJ905_00490 [Halalkalibaculum sp.]|nr:hypothetical protein [Halalkalibaculum sp.]